MSLLLRDVPGSLVKAIEPISKYGGNIVSIQHNRAKNGYADVQVVFEVKDKTVLGRIQQNLEGEKVNIRNIMLEGRIYQAKKTYSFIFIGHVIDTDIQDTVDRINEIGMVSDLDVVMPDPEKKSSVMFTVDVDEDNSRKMLNAVNKVCEEKGFLLIRSLEE
ncbi:ACT domain-containing protein [Candidatus Altiarchaeota archaeon]